MNRAADSGLTCVFLVLVALFGLSITPAHAGQLKCKSNRALEPQDYHRLEAALKQVIQKGDQIDPPQDACVNSFGAGPSLRLSHTQVGMTHAIGGDLSAKEKQSGGSASLAHTIIRPSSKCPSRGKPKKSI